MNIRYFEKRGTWWLDFKDLAGNRKRVPSHQTTEHKAREAAPAILAKFLSTTPTSEATSPSPRVQKSGLSFLEAFEKGMRTREKWITSKDRKGLRGNFSAMVAYWGADSDCSKATKDAVMKWRSHLLASEGKRKGTTMTPSSINHKLSMMSVLLEIAGCPPHGVKHLSVRGNERMRRVRDSELAAIRQWFLGNADRSGCLSMHSLVTVALHTAARQGELLALKWDDVYFDRSAVVFRDTKDHQGRTVPLSIQAAAILLDRRSGLAKGLAGPFSDLTKDRVVALWADARKALKLQDDDEFVFHALRHESLSRIADDGHNAYVIKDFAGHASVITTQRYVKSGNEALKAAANVFNK